MGAGLSKLKTHNDFKITDRMAGLFKRYKRSFTVFFGNQLDHNPRVLLKLSIISERVEMYFTGGVIQPKHE